MAKMSNPVQISTPTSSYQVFTDDQFSESIDAWTTGLTITVTLPGVVTTSFWVPRITTTNTTIYPETAFTIFMRIIVDIAPTPSTATYTLQLSYPTTISQYTSAPSNCTTFS